MAAPPLPASPPPEPTGGIVAPVPVVAPHFCAPYVVQLSVKEKFSMLREGDFTITETNGAVVVRVKGAFISIHNRRLLLDANGNPLLSLREKMHRQHNVTSTVLGTDHYDVTVFPNVDYVFISALVVILQELHTDKND
nr:unnamed protein product [Digitaria exilis]CAB3456127.1 unnamed protein product [Digitaria exilis]CAB3503297.1 unnamed protein product [Digitaria exilis]